jgi:hemerythrin-like metal-binding protein
MTLPPELLTGNALVDQQHANILLYVDKLLEDRLDTRLAFNLLLEHFTSHFLEEEKLMADAGYPEAWLHRLCHIAFFDIFVNLRAKFDMHPNDETRKAFVDGMMGWIDQHVMREDKKMAEFIRSNSKLKDPAKHEEP